jgi:hypothetical protein
MPSSFTRPRRGAAVVLAVAVALTLGCGGPKRKPAYTTEGKVLIDGEPAANVTVFLHPPASDPAPVRPLGVTDANGVFKLTSYNAYDGAPEGEYVVTLMYEPLDSPFLRKKGKKPNIPDKYTKAGDSPLRARVEPHPGNVLEPIKLP